jgi:cyclopropane-fatty-acyl-phospholipid synthase
MQTRADLLHPDGKGAARVPPGIFISTPERAPEDAANDPFMDDIAPAHNGSMDAPAKPSVRHLSLLLTSLFRDLDMPLRVRLWDNDVLHLGKPAAGQAPFELICRNPAAVSAMVYLHDPLKLAEAYIRNDIDVDGNFFAALRLKDHLQAVRPSLMQRAAGFVRLLNWSLLQAPKPLEREHVHLVESPTIRRHSRNANAQAVAFHYDVSNAFYSTWLDERMVYSCAYFRKPDDSLDKAQVQKLDHICRKLQLRPGDRLLDVGCGWGSLALHAARRYGVQVHGITLSHQQWEWATRAVTRQGLQSQVQIDLCDYRDLSEQARYDKVCSVGMFEHVGLENLPVYFSALHRVLKPGGLMLNHGISHEEEGWGKGLSSRFINRHVFPDGQLDTISRVQSVVERSGFEIIDIENLRPHYALTLRHWVQRLEEQREEALRHVNEATWRIWRLFMAGSALEFESGQLGVYQILAGKREGGSAPMSLTREHLYATQE